MVRRHTASMSRGAKKFPVAGCTRISTCNLYWLDPILLHQKDQPLPIGVFTAWGNTSNDRTNFSQCKDTTILATILYGYHIF